MPGTPPDLHKHTPLRIKNSLKKNRLFMQLRIDCRFLRNNPQSALVSNQKLNLCREVKRISKRLLFLNVAPGSGMGPTLPHTDLQEETGPLPCGQIGLFQREHPCTLAVPPCSDLRMVHSPFIFLLLVKWERTARGGIHASV